jgi:hypothetical protein
MSEKPKKRLVSKGSYLKLMSTRARLMSGTILFSVFGAMSLSATLWGMIDRHRQFWGLWLFETCLGFAFVAWAWRIASYCFREERKVERVAPITNRTASLVSPEESLVRASDVPPSQQQAELLRATQYGKETPAEELLRASRDRQDT